MSDLALSTRYRCRDAVRLGMLLLLVLAAQVGRCQVPPVDQPPPAIKFDDWKEVPSEEDISEYTLSFPSALPSPYAENNQVPIRATLPAVRDNPVPVVLILHYWGATDLRIENEFARQLNTRGIGAVIMTLPYHLSRTPKGFRSGQLAITPDPQALVRTMTQAILDVRRTVDFIETRPEFDHSKIGIAGTSLGSLISVLAYAVDSRISTAAFLLGGIDLAHIIWHSTIMVYVREGLRRHGYTEARLREDLQPIEATNYLKSRRAFDTFVIGGKYDKVVPPADTQKLIDALPGCKVFWGDFGHYGGVFVETRILRTVAEFFEQEFGGKKFVAPLRIYAPTLRIGALVESNAGLQVGAGIDLFKAGPKNEFFSTIIVTPKGLNLFAGVSIGQGLAAGGFATRRNVGVGLWWSTVL